MATVDSIGEVWSYRGEGVVSYSLTTPGVELGLGGGARRRVNVKMPLPKPEGSEASSGYLTVGVIAPASLRLPVRWRISLDNTGIARELRPQVSTEIDDGQVYHKIVFDVTPLARLKFSGRDVHQVSVSYDGLQPVLLNDIALVALFNFKEARTSATLFSGARSIDPGGKVIVYSRLGEYLGGVRRALATVYIPSPQSRLRFVAGGSPPQYATGPGTRVMDAEVPYKGYEVPVALVYEEPSTPIYPKTAVAGDVVVVENSIEGPLLEVRGISLERDEKGRVAASVVIANRGRDVCSTARLQVLAGEVVVASRDIGGIEAGSKGEYNIEFYAPPGAESLAFRLSWKVKGFPLARDVVVKLKA